MCRIDPRVCSPLPSHFPAGRCQALLHTVGVGARGSSVQRPSVKVTPRTLGKSVKSFENVRSQHVVRSPNTALRSVSRRTFRLPPWPSPSSRASQQPLREVSGNLPGRVTQPPAGIPDVSEHAVCGGIGASAGGWSGCRAAIHSPSLCVEVVSFAFRLPAAERLDHLSRRSPAHLHDYRAAHERVRADHSARPRRRRSRRASRNLLPMVFPWTTHLPATAPLRCPALRHFPHAFVISNLRPKNGVDLVV